MLFLLAGIALLAMKYLEIGAVGGWPWWAVLAPFGLAVAWWAWADASGYTKKKAQEKMDQRRKNRLDKQRESLGIGPKHRSALDDKYRDDMEAQAERKRARVEKERLEFEERANQRRKAMGMDEKKE